MSYSLLGKNFTPPDVVSKVNGKARYSEDMRAEGMLFCKLMLSPMPHANVKSIDATEALKMDGVVAVLTADDLPAVENASPGILTNEPGFVGDPIAAVAAESETIAANALEKIRLELEPLPFTVDPLESVYPGGPNARTQGNTVDAAANYDTVKWSARDFAAVDEGQLPMTGTPNSEWAFGELEASFAESKIVFDETFVTAANSHHSMEPRSAMAYWQNGKCYLHGSTQSQSFIMPGLARLLGVDLADLVYISEFCGGGFGSKALAYPIMAVPAYLARKAGRPVMMRISREEEYYLGAARGGFQGRIKIGFDDAGKVTGVDLYIVQQNGPYGTFLPDLDNAAGAVSMICQPHAMRYRGIKVLTNTPPATAQRGPGQNQIAMIVEPLLDKAAQQLGMDRLEIRRINCPDSNSLYGGKQQPVTSAYLREAMEMGADQFEWEKESALSGQRSGAKVIGIGVGRAYHSAGSSGFDGLVRITPDGKVHIHSGVGNLGTYSYAATSRVVAEVLKCDWSDCIIDRGDSSKHLPWNFGQFGSNTSFTMTRCNHAAAMDARRKLQQIASLEFGGDADDYDVGSNSVFRCPIQTNA